MRSSLIVGSILTAILGLASAAPAQAEETINSEQLALQVYLSEDPAKVMASLDAEQVAVLAERVSGWTAVESSSEVTKRPPTAQERTALTAAAAGGGCYQMSKSYKWYDLGFLTGETWMQANWCGNTYGITSYSLSNRGGMGYSGVSYKGLGATTVNNVGWEVRQGQVFKFSFGWASATPCMQARTGKTGLYAFQANCTLS